MVRRHHLASSYTAQNKNVQQPFLQERSNPHGGQCFGLVVLSIWVPFPWSIYVFPAFKHVSIYNPKTFWWVNRSKLMACIWLVIVIEGILDCKLFQGRKLQERFCVFDEEVYSQVLKAFLIISHTPLNSTNLPTTTGTLGQKLTSFKHALLLRTSPTGLKRRSKDRP